MSPSEIHAVTGAFGYSGKYIARRLLQAGPQSQRAVRTLTNSSDRTGEFQGRIETFPFAFDDPDRLTMQIYTHIDQSEHEEAINSLPPLPGMEKPKDGKKEK